MHNLARNALLLEVHATSNRSSSITLWTLSSLETKASITDKSGQHHRAICWL